MRSLPRFVTALAVLASLLFGCSGSDESNQKPTADLDVIVVGKQVSSSPHITLVSFNAQWLSSMELLTYTIAPKLGGVASPIEVQWHLNALKARGHFDASNLLLTIPVFGLYANHSNVVHFQAKSTSGEIRRWSMEINTPPIETNKIYEGINILKPHSAVTPLGFEFFAVKSGIGTPYIFDLDGQVRWGAAGPGSMAAIWSDSGFLVGDNGSREIRRLELDGSTSRTALIGAGYRNFHHNMDKGKRGFLGHVDTDIDGVVNLESTIIEFDSAGNVLKSWAFAAILANHLKQNGEDPQAFVRPGIDWFHSNAATYNPQEDSLIVSSRENFVISVDYATGAIRWIFGDPTKHWASFASLRAKALQLQSGGLYPIGQHSVSMTPQGQLMLFNNGANSLNQAAGAPAGDSRAYSAVTTYKIDLADMTARETWRFDDQQSTLSSYCSSAYSLPDESVLVNFAIANGNNRVRIVGLTPNHQIAFDFELKGTSGCSESWNAIPVPFGKLRFE